MDGDGLWNGMVPLTAADLRQYVYCPRVVFYRYCVPVHPPPTYKMIEGRMQHERAAGLEQRRGLRAYGLSDGERVFDVHLASERLGITGRVDMVILRRHEVIPVEFKHVEVQTEGLPRRKAARRWVSDGAREEANEPEGEGDEPPGGEEPGDDDAPVSGDVRRAPGSRVLGQAAVQLHHKYQLGAYALMAEERWRLPARRCFVHFVAQKRAAAVPISQGVRRYTRRLLAEARAMVAAQRIPPPTRRRGRCQECEFRRFCNDVD